MTTLRNSIRQTDSIAPATISESDTPVQTTTSVSVADTGKYTGVLSLGGETASYDLYGLKAALAAYAKKDSTKSELSYEYATRTVLKLRIDSGDATDTNPDEKTSITESGSTLTFKDLKVWVVGGDAPYGGNTLSPFPLDWSDPAYFKLMTGSWTTTSGELLGNWYWSSWDITTSTYHGFALGDVPSDAGDNGPKYWYMAECAWVAQKTYYILYPGETLEMKIGGDGAKYQALFLFRYKNEGKRSD